MATQRDLGSLCPASTAFCIGAGQERKVIVSTDPFARDPAEKGSPRGRGRGARTS